MKTEWDYTELAKAYLKRPEYSKDAIDQLISLTGMQENERACDVGAGVAHLTLELLEKGLIVCAVEPNDEMRKYGMARTASNSNVQWFEGVGENTTMPDASFDLVTFGSSFNVTDRIKALRETKRILKPQGWFACMWNHRDLNDPLQAEIESVISRNIEQYDYGTRREDQTKTIQDSGLFDTVHFIEGTTVHTISKSEAKEAWRSHGTLHRQAGPKFETIINNIENLIDSVEESEITIPYVTRMWASRLL